MIPLSNIYKVCYCHFIDMYSVSSCLFLIHNFCLFFSGSSSLVIQVVVVLGYQYLIICKTFTPDGRNIYPTRFLNTTLVSGIVPDSVESV